MDALDKEMSAFGLVDNKLTWEFLRDIRHYHIKEPVPAADTLLAESCARYGITSLIYGELIPLRQTTEFLDNILGMRALAEEKQEEA